jgi:hypothetical protein
MKDSSYAADNLRTIRENIYAYATYAQNWPDADLHEKVEEVQIKIDELIELIENN